MAVGRVGVSTVGVSIEDKLYITKFKVAQASHLRVKDPEVCRQCLGKPCLRVCPARVYEWLEDGSLSVGYEGCLECGTCRLLCEGDNLEWSYPTGGYGVIYRYG